MYKHQKGMAVGTTSDLLSTELQHVSEEYGIISFSEVIKTAWEENCYYDYIEEAAMVYSLA